MRTNARSFMDTVSLLSTATPRSTLLCADLVCERYHTRLPDEIRASYLPATRRKGLMSGFIAVAIGLKIHVRKVQSDPHVGRKLGTLLRSANFSRITLMVAYEIYQDPTSIAESLALRIEAPPMADGRQTWARRKARMFKR
ncbi:MAG: hypothetical protein ACREJU_08955 [Nitrospiraceae bacterium]